MLKILTVLGTRPEAIKMASVVKKFAEVPGIESSICVTAQHRRMLDQVLDLFAIIPDFDLDLMEEDQDLSDITSKALLGLRDVYRRYCPDWIFVQGDTNTTFAASLAAFYEKISVAHVEAGLRTGNIYAPWPEEMNRRLTRAIAGIHFAPTKKAAENLRNEGVLKSDICITGNTVIDALLQIIDRLRAGKLSTDKFADLFSFIDPQKKLILITGHRRENFGRGFEKICIALKKISERKDVQIIYPVHLNPNVREPVHKILGKQNNIFLLDPLDYVPFVYLMDKSYFIITDSGGVQEEAPSLGKPVLVIRELTERIEGINTGTVKLVGTDPEKIVNESIKLLDSQSYYSKMARMYNLYGDGKAAERIAEFIINRG